jgi:hypothetical protein
VLALAAIPAVPALAASGGAEPGAARTAAHSVTRSEQSAARSPVRLVAGRRTVHAAGRRWVPDRRDAVGGRVTRTSRGITGTRHDRKFQHSRVGVHGYRIPVSRPGRYRVTLDMTRAGRRTGVFSIRANGRSIPHRVRLTRTRHAYRRSFTTSTTGMRVRLHFIAKRGNAVVDSLVVRHLASRRSASPGKVPPAPAPSRATVLTPEEFGAVGDGMTDDSAALQRFFDAGTANNELVLPRGMVYAHSTVLQVRNPGELLVGPGTLLATAEGTSGVWLMANDIIVDNVAFNVASTTKRWVAFEQMEVRLGGYSGITLRDDSVSGSAAAGIYVGDAHHFTLDHVTVANTRADGIHMTGGSSFGTVISPTTVNTGDDGIAVVSYSQDGAPCHNITVTGARVFGTSWGRGMSVVGGQHITYRNVYIRSSDAAALYIAAEGAPYYTAAPSDVTVRNALIVDANQDQSVDQGAVLVNSGENSVVPNNITIDNVQISDTRATAARNVGVVSLSAQPHGIAFDRFTIRGGPTSAYQGTASAGSYSIRHWVVNGAAYPNHS